MELGEIKEIKPAVRGAYEGAGWTRSWRPNVAFYMKENDSVPFFDGLCIVG